ncbi:hypothetical protein CBS101457_006578 [Exobasidium rhododendri]|nr:hypothetical protein CBS101457_006578 [Exobasidium rhododendri]
MSSTKLRVGYVPEHFSLPILLLAKSEWGQQHLELVSQPSGTGQMLTSFNEDEPDSRKIDVAVALTEALITGLAKGRQDYELTGTYVKSSLNWAVITGTDEKASKYNSINDLRGTKIGISRIGSGSQIMASVMAFQHGWTGHSGSTQEIEFKVNDTFENLRKGVNQVRGLETSAFMWEWFTTKPFVDSGEVRFIGNVPTPWPSWTIAYSKSLSPSLQTTLHEFLERLQESIKTFTDPAKETESLDTIVEQMSYNREDVEKWWSGVRWVQDQRKALDGAESFHGQSATTQTVSKAVLEQTLENLEKAGVIKKPGDGWDFTKFVPMSKLIR